MRPGTGAAARRRAVSDGTAAAVRLPWTLPDRRLAAAVRGFIVRVVAPRGSGGADRKPCAARPRRPFAEVPLVDPGGNVGDVAHAIQLALAPVFMLTGIAGVLNVMTGRLARIVDRGRSVSEGTLTLDDGAREAVRDELENLEHRRKLTGRAINACTLSALLTCMVVATLFIEAMLGVSLRSIAGLCFIAAMFALIVGLGAFLREVHLSHQTVRIPVARFRL